MSYRMAEVIAQRARDEDAGAAEIVRLRVQAEKLHVIAKNVSHALMSFTPGGSEYFTRVQVGDFEDYYADADVCQQRVRERIDKAEEGVRDQYRMSRQLYAALQEIESIVDGKADADDGIPNDAMRILVIVRAALNIQQRASE